MLCYDAGKHEAMAIHATGGKIDRMTTPIGYEADRAADMQGPILLFLARLSAALTRAMVEARTQINSE